jgi:arylsulfatase
LLAVALACGRPAPVRVDDLSVVWIVLDAAGARHLSAYGNPLPTSPNVAALAADGGTVFERSYAQSAWTLPSTASFLTGRYPPRRKQTRSMVTGDTLATMLRDAGFRTAAFSENPYVTTTYGFDRGFETFREYFPRKLLDENPRFYTVESARTTTDALAWLDAHRDDRVFLYLHLLTPHSPYQPPSPFAGRFDADYAGTVVGVTDTLLSINEGSLAVTPRDLEHLRLQYEENLAYADAQVGRVVETLRRTGHLERTIVVVAADHGEAFREHGVMMHTATLYEEMIHVPLVIRLPSRFGHQPPRWSGIVELRDLVPTICQALRLDCHVGTERSLLLAMHARKPPERVARAWTSDAGALALGALVTNDAKLVLDMRGRHAALYDLAADPEERLDLAPGEPRRVRRLVHRLRAGSRGAIELSASHPVSEETTKKLRALGYTD